MKHVLAGTAFGLLALLGAAQADVKVTFVEPEKFTDIKDNTGFNRQDVLPELEAQLRKDALKYLPGKDVVLTVTDVDLAGDVEPLWRSGQWLRILRDITIPRMTLKYEVSEGGRLIRQGTLDLHDMNYREGFVRYPDSDPLRYDRRMIDRGFEKEFGSAEASEAGAKP